MKHLCVNAQMGLLMSQIHVLLVESLTVKHAILAQLAAPAIYPSNSQPTNQFAAVLTPHST